MEQQDPVSLLRMAINASGLSARRWAVEVAWRDERTIRRWLAGVSPIPGVVITKLRAIAMRLPAYDSSNGGGAQ